MPKTNPTSTRRRPACISLFLFLILSGLCLTLAAVTGLAALLPARAAQTFGPASPGLGPLQRVYYAFQLVLTEDSLTNPLDPAGRPRPFHIELGEPASSIVTRLYTEGLIADPVAFSVYLQYSGQDTSLQAGEYELSPAMPPLQIALAIQDSIPTHVRFGILPGWRLEEIAAAIPSSGLSFTPEEFLAATRQPLSTYRVPLDAPQATTVEGFLFPDTYRVPRQTSAAGLIQLALQNFTQKITPQMQQGFAAHGLDLYQAVTLASMVEREAILDEEMPLIASVFLNRLAQGIKLDSDPTVQYALGYNPAENTWWTNPLSSADLQVNSPFNTYQVASLPPAPIASPGLPALQAVASPAESPYYYFRAACDGSGRHTFARNLDEHIQNACP
jgi:UPF0755 protein